MVVTSTLTKQKDYANSELYILLDSPQTNGASMFSVRAIVSTINAT